MNSIERGEISEFYGYAVLTCRKLCSIHGKTPFHKRQLMKYHPNSLCQSGRTLALLNIGMYACVIALVYRMCSTAYRCPSGEARGSVSLEGNHELWVIDQIVYWRAEQVLENRR